MYLVELPHTLHKLSECVGFRKILQPVTSLNAHASNSWIKTGLFQKLDRRVCFILLLGVAQVTEVAY